MIYRTLLLASLAFGSLQAQERKLDIRDGDRVLLIGDVLIERENNYGYIEARMRREFAGKDFAVRNLGYSGDSPLGASRASFDSLAKGVDYLKEQLAVVKPTVAIIGYGMAASLDDLTYRKNDPVLNPDPVRYGFDHSPAKFRSDLITLMDLITKASPSGQVRFAFVGPVRHEDLRAIRPGLPDPAEHNALLAEYEKVIEQLAAEKQSPFVRGEWKSAGVNLAQGTDNGIHLTARGYRALSQSFGAQLGWKTEAANWDAETPQELSMREAILRKNALFFHRSRPANYTYIFGFRKGEQGRNAVEIPKFDPLVDKAEANVIGISAGKPSTLAPEPESDTKLPALPPLPHPEFTLDAGLQMTLFAENPLMQKPVGMNFDTAGRLWVASSNTYPQVNPDDLAAQMEGNSSKFGPSTGNDRIILLEDTNQDGVAETSRVVADKLLIPCGVAPDDRGGCFVGASTELLLLTKPDAKGMLTDRRIVLSGFGTEDTHHMVHGLHWGIDGRLYFQQTLYIHSHIETPWGLIRANSGVAFAYDPNTERLEVHSKGLVNCWGQQEDLAGQTFLTSGADGNGVSWSFPGAVLNHSEGARRSISSISPGSYPKFCGLEIVNSLLFGPEWQGSAITNDFRAHRMVRFSFNDLSKTENKSGYVTKVEPDVARSSDAAFRPVALNMGPDGGLYVADWTNPIINHGEVDFRDPRRNKEHGRIWRISPKGSKPMAWELMGGKPVAALLNSLLSPNRWEFQSARRELAKVPVADLQKALKTWAKDETTRRHAAWLLSGRTSDTEHLISILKSPQSESATLQVALREFGKSMGNFGGTDINAIVPFIAASQHPRVRLEAFRALARVRTFESADVVLNNLPANTGDNFLDFAAWTAVNELARPWFEEIATHPDKIVGREKQLTSLSAIVDPTIAAPFVQRLFAARELDPAGTGPWIELIGKSGGQTEVNTLGQAFLAEGKLQPAARLRAASALLEAAKIRRLCPQGDLAALLPLLKSSDPKLRNASIRLAGEWKQDSAIEMLAESAGNSTDDALRRESLAALRLIGGPRTVEALKKLVAEDRPASVRRDSLVPLAVHAGDAALAVLPSIIAQTTDKNQSLDLWRQLFQQAPFAKLLASQVPKELSPSAIADALQVASTLGRTGAELVKALQPASGAKPAVRDITQEIAALVKSVPEGGNSSEGERVYRRSGCIACHAIAGIGGNYGPDFSSIGASAPLDYIIESTLNPAAKVKEGYHGFAYTLKDGSVLSGIPESETATEIIIRVGPGVELPVTKANVLKKENIGSLMPPGLVDALSLGDQRNLFAFLSQIGRPGPFDASKANVARIWSFSSIPPGAQSKASDPVTFATTLVSGQLPKADLPAQPYASARFSVATATKTPLILTGAKAAWLNNQPIQLNNGRYETPIPPGTHTISISVDGTAPHIAAQCDDVTFLDVK
jgi:putative heme-binding domain-containing protein